MCECRGPFSVVSGDTGTCPGPWPDGCSHGILPLGCGSTINAGSRSAGPGSAGTAPRAALSAVGNSAGDGSGSLALGAAQADAPVSPPRLRRSHSDGRGSRKTPANVVGACVACRAPRTFVQDLGGLSLGFDVHGDNRSGDHVSRDITTEGACRKVFSDLHAHFRDHLSLVIWDRAAGGAVHKWIQLFLGLTREHSRRQKMCPGMRCSSRESHDHMCRMGHCSTTTEHNPGRKTRRRFPGAR